MHRIAVLIPCYNEAITVRKVVDDFSLRLPNASIFVFDNNSTDNTAAEARMAGAIVKRVPVQGKGEVVRAMFREVDADVYVMVDGDDTYPASAAAGMVARLVESGAEMVVGTRLQTFKVESFRNLHFFGNRLVITLVNIFFKAKLTDVMSGYRVFSRRFVKTMPVLSKGFEVETEMTLHALEQRMHVEEHPIEYGVRPDGSSSKLRTVSDGIRVLTTIFNLYRYYRPLSFFGLLGIVFFFLGTALGCLVMEEFYKFSHVTGVARAILATTFCFFGSLLIGMGILLDTINRRSREMYTLMADNISRQKPS